MAFLESAQQSDRGVPGGAGELADCRRFGRLDMRQLCWVGLVLVLFGLAAGPARAVTYDDSFEECNYPKTFDLLVMRPVSLLTVVGGGLLFFPLSPFALLMVPNDMGTVYDNLVGAPVRFTFDRRLGECTSVQLGY